MMFNASRYSLSVDLFDWSVASSKTPLYGGIPFCLRLWCRSPPHIWRFPEAQSHTHHGLTEDPCHQGSCKISSGSGLRDPYNSLHNPTHCNRLLQCHSMPFMWDHGPQKLCSTCFSQDPTFNEWLRFSRPHNITIQSFKVDFPFVGICTWAFQHGSTTQPMGMRNWQSWLSTIDIKFNWLRLAVW